MNQDFLKQVQDQGWIIEAADQNMVVAPCPNKGCNVRAKLQLKNPVPAACRSGIQIDEQIIEHFEDARTFLKKRRETLRFTIRDVECISGMADDFLAKFEKKNPSKFPNVQTFIEWAKALGFQVVLTPTEMTPMALRIIAETRHLIPARDQMTAQHRARRKASDAQAL